MFKHQRPALGPLLLLVAAILHRQPLPVVAAGHETDVRATVLSIDDGDTMRVRRQGETITSRLACIDAAAIAQSP